MLFEEAGGGKNLAIEKLISGKILKVLMHSDESFLLRARVIP
jgi:hypothetical protein